MYKCKRCSSTFTSKTGISSHIFKKKTPCRDINEVSIDELKDTFNEDPSTFMIVSQDYEDLIQDDLEQEQAQINQQNQSNPIFQNDLTDPNGLLERGLEIANRALNGEFNSENLSQLLNINVPVATTIVAETTGNITINGIPVDRKNLSPQARYAIHTAQELVDKGQIPGIPPGVPIANYNTNINTDMPDTSADPNYTVADQVVNENTGLKFNIRMMREENRILRERFEELIREHAPLVGIDPDQAVRAYNIHGREELYQEPDLTAELNRAMGINDDEYGYVDSPSDSSSDTSSDSGSYIDADNDEYQRQLHQREMLRQRYMLEQSMRENAGQNNRSEEREERGERDEADVREELDRTSRSEQISEEDGIILSHIAKKLSEMAYIVSQIPQEQINEIMRNMPDEEKFDVLSEEYMRNRESGSSSMQQEEASS